MLTDAQRETLRMLKAAARPDVEVVEAVQEVSRRVMQEFDTTAAEFVRAWEEPAPRRSSSHRRAGPA